MFDLLIKNGTVVDGTGGLAFPADVAVQGDEIAALGTIDAEARETVDASGLTVTPGFIDLHSHSDGSFLIDSKADSKLRQGVTLELMGNCGMSVCAPLRGTARDAMAEWLERYDTDLDVGWTDMGGYLDALEAAGSTVNLVAQVGHGTVRRCVLGMEARAPTVDELAEMRALVAESIDQGALGFATGLFYSPGSYSLTDEVISLAEEAAARGALYSSHLRSEGADGPGLFTAYQEAIEIGRRTGVRVEISHVKCKGKPVWGRASEVLEMMERARREGLDVAGDQYPYPRSSTALTGALFPRWALAGGRAATLERMGDADTRAQIRAGIAGNIALYESADAFAIASFAPRTEIEGSTLGEIAREGDKSPEEAALSLYEMGEASVVLASLRQDDVDTIAAAPFIAVASDGSSLRTEGQMSRGTPHPRSYGTFPRFLHRYVTRLRRVRVEEAVHRMTGLPASRLELTRRGRIAPGYRADLVAMDLDNVADTATFAEPHSYPTGITHVWVNGDAAVRDGESTGATAGRVIRDKRG